MRSLFSFLCTLLLISCVQAHKTKELVIINPIFGIDDYTSILKDAFEERPKTVIFKEGTYSFKNVVITSNVNIIAEGHVVFCPMLVPQSLQRTGVNLYNSMFIAHNVDSLSIRGMKFEGVTSKGIIDDGYKSSFYYSTPLVFINNAKYVSIDSCVFKNIEGCTYSSNDYTYYGNKKGLLVCLYDVEDVWIKNNEITGCRHDEQVWSIAVKKNKRDLTVHFANNYIHDETPAVNSSAFSCVAGNVFVHDNVIERFNYKGSIFNLFGDVVHAENNTVKDSYATSVFDTGEYGYFFADSVFVRNNKVSAKNSQLLTTMANYIECTDNTFEGITLLVSENQPAASMSKYRYFYQKEKPRYANSAVIVERNRCNFTLYDSLYSIILPEKYGYGVFISPYYNFGNNVSIRDNEFTAFDIIGKKKLGYSCNVMKIVNMNVINIERNLINGAWYHPGSTVYTAPILVETELRNFFYRLDSESTYGSIKKIKITNNMFESSSPNNTTMAINRHSIDGALRVDEIEVENNTGTVGLPMLYNTFAEKFLFNNGSGQSLVGIPYRKLSFMQNDKSTIRNENEIRDGERLENGTIIRLSDQSMWRATNVVVSFKRDEPKINQKKRDEMFFQGVYWVKIQE